ncbi:molecular chaperone DnaJ [Escherichia coli]|nr:molecular chaperone DnaJ [Escherichia coli]
MTTITREQAQKIIEAADEVISALAGTNEDVHPGSDNMLRLWDDLNDRYAPPEVVRELARITLASLEAEPVSQTYNLPELIEGMEVSIDVSTCDADLGNRYFGTVTEASELDTAKNGYILLVQDAEPNFDVNGNSPVTPDGWVIVPKKLTAENGAKGVLSGEFSETTFISCPECFGDDDCDTCDGSGRIEIKVPVTWTTIKSIWDKGIAYFAAEPRQEVNRG